MALFVVFEGGEGCGKTTQARALQRRLVESGVPVVLTREPGGTRLGERIRRYLKQADRSQISPAAELFLISAARAQIVNDVIRPALSQRKVVICDRYTPSTLAYQGYGRELNMDAIRLVNDIATGGLTPDLIVLIDMPVEVGLGRKRSEKWDRFESESLAFHERVCRGYLDLVKSDPHRWLVVDGQLSRREIHRLIWERVEILIQREACHK